MIQFLGLVIDSLSCTLELPADIMLHLIEIATSYATRVEVAKKELQALVGHMRSASRAVYGALLSRVYL